MIENLTIFFIISVAIYYLVKTLIKSFTDNSGGCAGCPLGKKDNNCKMLCDKLKQKD